MLEAGSLQAHYNLGKQAGINAERQQSKDRIAKHLTWVSISSLVVYVIGHILTVGFSLNVNSELGGMLMCIAIGLVWALGIIDTNKDSKE